MQKLPDEYKVPHSSSQGDYTEVEEILTFHDAMSEQQIPRLEDIFGNSDNPNLPVLVLDPNLMIIHARSGKTFFQYFWKKS